MKRFASVALVCFALSLGWALSSFAQSSSGMVHGSVLDPSGAVIAGAVVTIQNPVSHYTRITASDSQGKFELDNIPYNNYHLTVAATGFQAGTQDIDVRSSVPRSEEHTSELQSPCNLVCRLLLEKKT